MYVYVYIYRIMLIYLTPAWAGQDRDLLGFPIYTGKGKKDQK